MIHVYPYVLVTFWYNSYGNKVDFGVGTILGDMMHGPVRWYSQPTLGMDGVFA